MAALTSLVVPDFDFSDALRLPLAERIDQCLKRARELAKSYQTISDFPCVPESGGTEAELAAMESRLGRPLPMEYRAFLSRCRYLKIADGLEVGGLDHQGRQVTERPWISRKHRAGVEYLVFASYGAYADGDQLMFDMSGPGFPVVAYLHEHGPLYEAFAPSFSLALWRLVDEFDEPGEPDDGGWGAGKQYDDGPDADGADE